MWHIWMLKKDVFKDFFNREENFYYKKRITFNPIYLQTKNNNFVLEYLNEKQTYYYHDTTVDNIISLYSKGGKKIIETVNTSLNFYKLKETNDWYKSIEKLKNIKSLTTRFANNPRLQCWELKLTPFFQYLYCNVSLCWMYEILFWLNFLNNIETIFHKEGVYNINHIGKEDDFLWNISSVFIQNNKYYLFNIKHVHTISKLYINALCEIYWNKYIIPCFELTKEQYEAYIQNPYDEIKQTKFDDINIPMKIILTKKHNFNEWQCDTKIDIIDPYDSSKWKNSYYSLPFKVINKLFKPIYQNNTQWNNNLRLCKYKIIKDFEINNGWSKKLKPKTFVVVPLSFEFKEKLSWETIQDFQKDITFLLFPEKDKNDTIVYLNQPSQTNQNFYKKAPFEKYLSNDDIIFLKKYSKYLSEIAQFKTFNINDSCLYFSTYFIFIWNKWFKIIEYKKKIYLPLYENVQELRNYFEALHMIPLYFASHITFENFVINWKIPIFIYKLDDGFPNKIPNFVWIIDCYKNEEYFLSNKYVLKDNQFDNLWEYWVWVINEYSNIFISTNMHGLLFLYWCQTQHYLWDKFINIAFFLPDYINIFNSYFKLLANKKQWLLDNNYLVQISPTTYVFKDADNWKTPIINISRFKSILEKQIIQDNNFNNKPIFHNPLYNIFFSPYITWTFSTPNNNHRNKVVFHNINNTDKFLINQHKYNLLYTALLNQKNKVVYNTIFALPKNVNEYITETSSLKNNNYI